jgi:hypothetical protein
LGWNHGSRKMWGIRTAMIQGRYDVTVAVLPQQRWTVPFASNVAFQTQLGENRKHYRKQKLQTKEVDGISKQLASTHETCFGIQGGESPLPNISEVVARHSDDPGRSTQVDLPVCLQPLTSEKHFTSKCCWRRWWHSSAFLYTPYIFPIILFTCSHVLTHTRQVDKWNKRIIEISERSNIDLTT